MRQLTTTELNTISGGNDALLLGVGLGLGAMTLGILASYPTYYSYPSYPVYAAPVCQQVVTPVFDPYTGMYMGDMVDTYCY
ncbi:hypothetical protein [Candidatus Berkiella aquae]|uniref:Uncharacterized protein n=1 Tax=Candidatus Berkiella aquae TaxID=295108 RepID=A0A0Q9YXC5_9GAMM|nr:hypothetical protein [Candidatus Berkiella aquae]MCS5711268.1 hypothetical protein [Candidatus Berkiella aquae]